MDTLNLGKLIEGEAERDAIHIAVAPVVASEPLQRGERVVLVNSTDRVRAQHDETAIGIVDPFLDVEYVRTGQRFWLFLLPNTVTGLRHHWSHPEFAEQDVPSAPTRPKNRTVNQQKAEAWIRAFAAKWNFDYDELIQEASAGPNHFIVADGRDIHSACDLDDGDEEAFWKHLGTLTGRTFDHKHQVAFGWSCSC